MQAMDYLSMLFRWFHIIWGIVWIGLLYFFNWVNGPFTATMDAETKKKVIPELAPRALFWFRWGAAYTWILGIFLLGLVYENGTIYLSDPASATGMSHILFFSFLIVPFIYDMLAKSALAKNPKVFAGLCFVLVAIIIYVLGNCCGFSYRGYVMYIGAMFGTTMAYNVWFRIWPNQKIIINGVKTGVPADAGIVSTAGTRSKHNTYMSIPLVWTMINAHTVTLAGDYGWVWLVVVIFIGWMAANGIYKRAAKIKGF